MMSTSMNALLGFAAWTLLLVVLVLLYRGAKILGGTRADSWTRGRAIEDPPVIARIAHAHLNALENLPIFAVLVLVAAAQGKTAAIATLAPWVLYARIVQSLVHVIGVNHWLVQLRAVFWVIQIVLFAIMFARLFG